MQRGMSAMGLTTEQKLTEAEAAQIDQMRRDMGRSMIRQWKLNKALHHQYGGRIIYQQLGPEPLDAYRQYLEERRDAGDFKIHQQEFERFILALFHHRLAARLLRSGQRGRDPDFFDTAVGISCHSFRKKLTIHAR
jgi:hypothetical protein